MAVSKNNPAVRDNQRLVIRCPACSSEMSLLKRVPGGMHYVCQKDGNAIPVRKGIYKDLPHEWVRKT
ncbi:MAG: hypothetical protein IT371_12860 [Deltaproteobacteria bacterium]|nr:hypothetical protein [Deltaproteobacteria bacterium]